MDKNDFDVDFDFSKDLGFDPDELLGSDDPGDFDMSQFDEDDLNLSELLGEDAPSDEENFQDYNMDEEELRSEGDFEPYPPDPAPEQGEDADYGESEDLGEDLFFPKRSRRNDGQGDDRGAYDAEGAEPEDYDSGNYDPETYDPEDYAPEEGGENDGDVDTYAPGEPVDEPSTREDRKKLNLKKTFSNLFPKKTDTGRKREAKERREPQKPSFFSKFLDWYMEPLNRRNAPETEYVDENGRRRRRRRPTKAQIFKEAYLPAIIAGVAVILILSFVVGAITNGFKNKKIKDEQTKQSSIAAQEQADAAVAAYQQLLAEAELKATEYDYDGAIEVLDSLTDTSEEVKNELTAKKAAYLNEKSKLVEWKDVNAIPNLSFHVLIENPVRAYADKEFGGLYNKNFVTTGEFSKILEQLYHNGYVLVDMKSFVASNEDLTGAMNYSYKSIYLPEGKKPVMITETMVNYFEYMVDSNDDGEPDAGGDGFACRLVVDANGDIKAQYVDESNQTLTGDYDLVPILETFIKAHPDFVYKGSRATLAVTGSQGVFGYRTDSSYVAKKGQEYRDQQVAEAKVVVDALREKGYTIACYTYGNKNYRNMSVSELRTDLQNFTNQAIPVLGDVDTIIFAQGVDLESYSDNKFDVLYSAGYRYFIGASQEIKTEINITYVHQSRLMVTGNAMAWHNNLFTNYFDCNVVLDVANRGNVPN